MRSIFTFLFVAIISVSLLAITPIFAKAQGVATDKTITKGTAVSSTPAQPAIKDPENTLFMDLKDGRVIIQMRPDLAPKHVARIKELVRQKFYDGLAFHRVIDGFMAQGGDPKGDGTGGSGQNIGAEFSSTAKHVRGTASMARAANPDSADSQFFICLADAPFLDGQYTIWGEVISGMEFVDHIKKGNKANNGAVIIPDKIVKMQVAADVKE